MVFYLFFVTLLFSVEKNITISTGLCTLLAQIGFPQPKSASYIGNLHKLVNKLRPTSPPFSSSITSFQQFNTIKHKSSPFCAFLQSSIISFVEFLCRETNSCNSTILTLAKKGAPNNVYRFPQEILVFPLLFYLSSSTNKSPKMLETACF